MRAPARDPRTESEQDLGVYFSSSSSLPQFWAWWHPSVNTASLKWSIFCSYNLEAGSNHITVFRPYNDVAFLLLLASSFKNSFKNPSLWEFELFSSYEHIRVTAISIYRTTIRRRLDSTRNKESSTIEEETTARQVGISRIMIESDPYPRVAAAAAAKLLQSCPTLCDPIDGSPPGFPKQEHWSGLPFPSPMQESEK